MRLNDYSHKRRVKFWGKDEYYLGVELEVEAPDYESRTTGLKPIVCGVYAKHDGSLNEYGWEIVTHPFARSLWMDPSPRKGPVQKFFKLVASLRGLEYQSHDGGRCGLHVHVCRKAFGKTLGSHFYWFARLVSGSLFRRLSQRTESSLNRFTRQIRPKLVKRGYAEDERKPVRIMFADTSRYVATNVTSNTVEVRIFRGNLREGRIRKAVESVVAAVEFARTRSSRNWREDLDKEFIAYALRNKRVYPNLVSYLVEIGLTESGEDRENLRPREEVPACA